MQVLEQLLILGNLVNPDCVYIHAKTHINMKWLYQNITKHKKRVMMSTMTIETMIMTMAQTLPRTSPYRVK